MANSYHSIALRCIGQDLERRGLRTFEIKREGRHFVALCDCVDSTGSAPQSVRYTPADIDLLDRYGEVQRGKTAGQEFLNQGQMLRAIGDYLDKYDSNLILITKNDDQSEDSLFRVEYITREGEHVVDDRPGSAIFDMCVLMVQKRQWMLAAGRTPHEEKSKR